MIERLWRSERTRPARARIARCADMVFCGTSRLRAISPAARPSGSWRTNSRNVSSRVRSEEHTSELQSLMRISYAVFCLKKKKHKQHHNTNRVTLAQY